jgi:hypothetical protein
MSKATDIVAVRLTGINKDDRARGLPGAFWYVSSESHGPKAGIIHSCPCGCGNLGHLNLDPAADRPLWTNSGTEEKPTLRPSVGIKKYRDDQDVEADGYHWHGYLTDGIWTSC